MISHPAAGTFSLKLTPTGQLGVFCEQAENWEWFANLPFDIRGLKALNLFAYTGGTTLALARQGAHVVHVDSAKNVVNWARSNAEISQLQGSPIRWINDDAIRFVQREIKRGNFYDIIVADPPAVGHGMKRMTWKFTRDIASLFDMLGRLTVDRCSAVLITGHTAGFDGNDLLALAESCLGTAHTGRSESGRLDLFSTDGRGLNCGYFYRWHQ